MTDQTAPAPEPVNSEQDDVHALAELAAVPELAGIKPGSPDHLDLISKTLLAMHARIGYLETHLAGALADAEGAAEKVIRL
jgi:hypothetical protein